MYVRIALEILAIVTALECCDIYSSKNMFEDGLPTVNLKEPDASLKLVTALKDWGFSYITGHDVPEDVTKKAYEKSKQFFRLPKREKRQLQADRFQAIKTSRGYAGQKDEQLNPNGLPDVKEHLDVGIRGKTASSNVRHHLGENQWPRKKPAINQQRPLSSRPAIYQQRPINSRPFRKSNLSGGRGKRDTDGEMKNAIENYAEHVSMLAQNVLKLTAQELGCGSEFDHVFGPDALQVQRLTRYPPSHEIIKAERGQIGAGEHSDYGGFTILSAEGPGLYVLKPNETSEHVESGTFSPELLVPNSGKWVEVESLYDTFIVMAGEALQILSNGQIYAAKHKVEFTGSMPRYSLAFFYDPNPDAVLEPLECARRNSLPLYKAKIAGHKGVIRKMSDKGNGKTHNYENMI